MTTPTQSLRDEHRQLRPHLENLLRIADSVERIPLPALLEQVDQMHGFLAHSLVPHEHAEDQALYPIVSKALGSPWATKTMHIDHLQVGALIEQLGTVRAQLDTEPLNAFRANELRRILYGLYALLKTHFLKEEDVYLALLDTLLTPEEADKIHDSMEEAANQARAALV